MMFDKSLKEQMLDKCRHFTGIHNGECRVGIDYMTMRQLPEDGGMAQWPCHHKNLGGLCNRFDGYTEEEAQAREDGHRKNMKALNDLSTRKSNTCFQCGEEITAMRQVGRCVYAAPCECRLWQGSIPESWRTPSNSNLGNVHCACCDHNFTVPDPDGQGVLVCPECGRIT
jgi:hypothetical protein